MTTAPAATICWNEQVAKTQEKGNTCYRITTTDGRITVELIQEPSQLTLIIMEVEGERPDIRTFTQFKTKPTANEVMLRRFPNPASYAVNLPVIECLLAAVA